MKRHPARLGWLLAITVALGIGVGAVLNAWRVMPLAQTGYAVAATGTGIRLGGQAHTSVILLDGRGEVQWSSPASDTTGPDRLFRTGSVTKTFVAAAVLRLMEQGKLQLDDPIATLLPERLDALLRADGYDTGAISVRMLLDHTSGIADFFSMPGWIEGMLAAPDRVWTPEEQIALTTDRLEPVAPPGDVFAYSDTGYVLAGAIIETVTGTSLDTALRDLLRFDELGLTATGIEGADGVANRPRARQILSGVDGWTIHPSVDAFGAGGLVTTSKDLATFFGALASDLVFDREETLQVMLKPSPQSLQSDPDGYGLGVTLARVRGRDCFGHGGFWGVLALACPGTGITAAGMVTDAAGQAALKDQIGASVWISLRPGR